MKYMRSYWVQVVIFLLIFVYVGLNLFQVGGSEFIIPLNNFFVIPFALGTTILAILLPRKLHAGDTNRILWIGLAFGWALWTIAEAGWAMLAIVGQEQPYPSWMDFLWIFGYFPMYYVMLAKMRSIPQIINKVQRFAILALSLFILAISTVLIFVPILQSNDPANFLESMFNFLYPLADVVLLIIVLRFVFTYQHSMYGRAWYWLGLGFIIVTLGDLGFTYANNAGLYYPDQQINFISTFGADIPYNLSYPFWIIGLLILRKMQHTYKSTISTVTPLELVPNTHLLLITTRDDFVAIVSQNFSQIFPYNPGEKIQTAQALGLASEDAESLLRDIKEKKILQERALLMRTKVGLERVLVSGVAYLNSQKEYSNASLLLRLFVDDYTLDDLATDYQKGVIRILLSETGTRQKEEEEIRHLLSGYYQDLIRAFYNYAIEEWGSTMAEALVTSLQTAVKENGWAVGINPDTSLDLSTVPYSEMRKVLSSLNNTSLAFMSKLTDSESVDKIVQTVRGRLGTRILKNIAFHETAQASH